MQYTKVKISEMDRFVVFDHQLRLVEPINDYLEFQRKIGRAENTICATAMDLMRFWEFMDENYYVWTDLSVDMIADFLDYLRGTQDAEKSKRSARTNRTINRIVSSVRSFYEYQLNRDGKSEGTFPGNYETTSSNAYQGMLQHIKADRKTIQSVFKQKENLYQVHLVTEEEMQQFLSAVERTRDRLMFQMMYFTGARIQEVLDLEISSVPVPDEKKAVGIFRQIRSKGKKRDVYAPMNLIREMDTYVYEEREQIQTEHRQVFVSEKKNYRGKPLTYHAVYDRMRRIQELTGVRFNFHDLRHTFCVNLIRSGIDISVVQILMGHAHLHTTQNYMHLDNGYLQECLERYWNKNQLLGGSHG